MDQNILLKSNKNTDELVLNGRVYQIYGRKKVKEIYMRNKYSYIFHFPRVKDWLNKINKAIKPLSLIINYDDYEFVMQKKIWFVYFFNKTYYLIDNCLRQVQTNSATQDSANSLFQLFMHHIYVI